MATRAAVGQRDQTGLFRDFNQAELQIQQRRGVQRVQFLLVKQVGLVGEVFRGGSGILGDALDRALALADVGLAITADHVARSHRIVARRQALGHRERKRRHSEPAGAITESPMSGLVKRPERKLRHAMNLNTNDNNAGGRRSPPGRTGDHAAREDRKAPAELSSPMGDPLAGTCRLSWWRLMPAERLTPADYLNIDGALEETAMLEGSGLEPALYGDSHEACLSG
jgi:hypothetical protein